MNQADSFRLFVVVALALNGVPATTAPMVSGQESTHPQIDCPLRKQGIDTTHMRPFEDVEKYVAFLERSAMAALLLQVDVLWVVLASAAVSAFVM
jgi:hypothetical protein